MDRKIKVIAISTADNSYVKKYPTGLVYSETLINALVLHQSMYVYLISDEVIQPGDYWLYVLPDDTLEPDDNGVPVLNVLPSSWFKKLHDKHNYKKIIASNNTTIDLPLLRSEFLSWYCRNTPEFVSVKYQNEWRTNTICYLYKSCQECVLLGESQDFDICKDGCVQGEMHYIQKL